MMTRVKKREVAETDDTKTVTHDEQVGVVERPAPAETASHERTEDKSLRELYPEVNWKAQDAYPHHETVMDQRLASAFSQIAEMYRERAARASQQPRKPRLSIPTWLKWAVPLKGVELIKLFLDRLTD
jgi:hypothetical protein